jgi:hypothetical protein
MNTQIITSSRRAICQYFFQIFTVPTADIFIPLVNGWILCTARRTVTGIIRFAELFIERPHDAFHRFFSCAVWQLFELWRLLAILLIKTFYPAGIIPHQSRRYFVSQAGQKQSGGVQMARPGAFTKDACICKGLESGRADVAGKSAPGWRVDIAAYKYATAYQGRPQSYRPCRMYACGVGRLAAGTSVYMPLRRVLHRPDRQGFAANSFNNAYEKGRDNFRFASQKRKTPTRSQKNTRGKTSKADATCRLGCGFQIAD